MQCLLDKKRGKCPTGFARLPLLGDIGLFWCRDRGHEFRPPRGFPKDPARCPAERQRPVLHVCNHSACPLEPSPRNRDPTLEPSLPRSCSAADLRHAVRWVHRFADHKAWLLEAERRCCAWAGARWVWNTKTVASSKVLLAMRPSEDRSFFLRLRSPARPFGTNMAQPRPVEMISRRPSFAISKSLRNIPSLHWKQFDNPAQCPCGACWRRSCQ
jgi:hypothetical protein